jgi:hypothetical protein
MTERDSIEKIAAPIKEIIDRFEVTMPSPLNKRGESTMHPCHHAGLVFEARKALEALQQQAEPVGDLIVYGDLDRSCGFSPRTHGLPPGTHPLYASAPPAQGVPADVREAIAMVRRTELFADGVIADLPEHARNDPAEAFLIGRDTALEQLAAVLAAHQRRQRTGSTWPCICTDSGSGARARLAPAAALAA